MTKSANLNLTLITGASEGIGKAFATYFAEQGHDLVLVARSEDKLKALADELSREYSVRTHVYTADLTEPDSASKLYTTLKEDELQHLAKDDKDPDLMRATQHFLKEREAIKMRLKGAGASIVDCAPDQFCSRLINAYLAIKARKLL